MLYPQKKATPESTGIALIYFYIRLPLGAFASFINDGCRFCWKHNLHFMRSIPGSNRADILPWQGSGHPSSPIDLLHKVTVRKHYNRFIRKVPSTPRRIRILISRGRNPLHYPLCYRGICGPGRERTAMWTITLSPAYETEAIQAHCWSRDGIRTRIYLFERQVPYPIWLHGH